MFAITPKQQMTSFTPGNRCVLVEFSLGNWEMGGCWVELVLRIWAAYLKVEVHKISTAANHVKHFLWLRLISTLSAQHGERSFDNGVE